MKLRTLILTLACAGAALLPAGRAARAQMNPAEIRDPKLKALEQADFDRMMTLARDIRSMKFPFPFVLSRYVGLDPKQEAGTDTRGLEFVRFHNRVLLKLTGNYNAAFNATMLTGNQRANQVLGELVVPLMAAVTQAIPPRAEFDGYGFEVSYHVRKRTRNYDYEGKEILTLVFDKDDAVNYLQAQRDSARQEILDRSEIYLDGADFGLALGEREPFQVSDSEKAARHGPAREAGAKVQAKVSAAPAPASPPAETAGQTAPPESPSKSSQAPAAAPQPAATASAAPDRLPGVTGGEASGGFHLPSTAAPATGPMAEERAMLSGTAATKADADALQTKLQVQLQALDQEGRKRFHFVDYAPPSLGVFRNQIYLQLTLRNPALYDRNATSIYRRAAQSFDLFLAPMLKGILEKVPNDPGLAGLDVTVLNEFSPQAASSSEAVEYLCPLTLLRRFEEAEITNQDVINQSVVLVNGVRVSLNLQQVE